MDWKDAAIDLDGDGGTPGYQELRKQWTGKCVADATIAFIEAKFDVEVVPASKWKTGQHLPHGIFLIGHVTLYLAEDGKTVDHICDG
jgi:hypothetical protein